MSKMITEEIRRLCCDKEKDLVRFFKKPQLFICKHCIQIWEYDRRTDASGSMDWNWFEVEIPIYET